MQYSERYLRIISRVLKHEGGYVDHKNDPGGATNWGISLRWLKGIGDLNKDGFLDGDLDHDGDVDKHDIRRLTREDAIRLYWQHWWDKYRYEELESPLAEKVFDMSINMGSKQAHKLLQRGANTLGCCLTEDGIIGPNTIKACAALKPQVLVNAVCREQEKFYEGLVGRNPKFKAFIRGWRNRAYAFHSEKDTWA